jgi:hypothetical protein
MILIQALLMSTTKVTVCVSVYIYIYILVCSESPMQSSLSKTVDGNVFVSQPIDQWMKIHAGQSWDHVVHLFLLKVHHLFIVQKKKYII